VSNVTLLFTDCVFLSLWCKQGTMALLTFALVVVVMSWSIWWTDRQRKQTDLFWLKLWSRLVITQKFKAIYHQGAKVNWEIIVLCEIFNLLESGRVSAAVQQPETTIDIMTLPDRPRPSCLNGRILFTKWYSNTILPNSTVLYNRNWSDGGLLSLDGLRRIWSPSMAAL
jgi:hypothetical protein